MNLQDEQNSTSKTLQRFMSIRAGLLVIIVFTVVITIVSIGIAAAIGAVVGTKTAGTLGQTGQVFESVVAVFSGLAFVALVTTFLLQLEELRLQRSELADQKVEMGRSQRELHRTAEAVIRMLHVVLIKMSIDNELLAAVWPELSPDISPDQAKQYTYANLIIQHHRLIVDLGNYGQEEVKHSLRYLFGSPLMREYWLKTSHVRNIALVPDTPEWEFANIVDEICAEITEPPEPSDTGLSVA